MCDTLRPHGLQHTSLLCLLSSEVSCNSCPLNQWCHPIISSFAPLFSFCLHCFPASESFHWVSSLHQMDKALELLQSQEIETIGKHVGRCFVPDCCIFPDRDLWSYLTVSILQGCWSVGCWYCIYWYFPLDAIRTSFPPLVVPFRDK